MAAPMTIEPLTPVRRNVSFEAEANAYLSQLFPTGRGIGPFLSQMIIAHKTRREVAAEYEALSSKEQWGQDGGMYLLGPKKQQRPDVVSRRRVGHVPTWP